MTHLTALFNSEALLQWSVTEPTISLTFVCTLNMLKETHKGYKRNLQEWLLLRWFESRKAEVGAYGTEVRDRLFIV